MNVEDAIVVIGELIVNKGNDTDMIALKRVTQELDSLRADKRRMAEAIRAHQNRHL